MSDASEASWRHPKNKAALVSAVVGVGTFLFSVFTYMEAREAKERAALVAQKMEQSTIVLGVINEATKWLEKISTDKEALVENCAIVSTYAAVEARVLQAAGVAGGVGGGDPVLPELFETFLQKHRSKFGEASHAGVSFCRGQGLDHLREVETDTPSSPEKESVGETEIELSPNVAVVSSFAKINCQQAEEAKEIIESALVNKGHDITRLHLALAPTRAVVSYSGSLAERDGFKEVVREIANEQTGAGSVQSTLSIMKGVYSASSKGWEMIEVCPEK